MSKMNANLDSTNYKSRQSASIELYFDWLLQWCTGLDPEGVLENVMAAAVSLNPPIYSKARCIADIVREDLEGMGVVVTSRGSSDLVTLTVGGVVIGVLSEPTNKACWLALSDAVFSLMPEEFDHLVGPLVRVANRRQWRIVKPLLKQFVLEFRAGVGAGEFEPVHLKLQQIENEELNTIFPLIK